MLAAIVTSTRSSALSPWGTPSGPSRALCVLPSEKISASS
jgi:hypothetical protein